MPPYSKGKNDIPKLTMKKEKPLVGMIEQDSPIVDSPVPIEFDDEHPGVSPQELAKNLSAILPLEHKAPSETPHCKHCGRELGVHPTEVLPNNDNPSSGL